jgi:hypothetical protein
MTADGRDDARDQATDDREWNDPPGVDLGDDDEKATMAELEELEGIQVRSLDEAVERGRVDVENALFVVLGVALSVLVVLRFLSVVPS